MESGLWLGHSRTFTDLSWSHCLVVLAVCPECAGAGHHQGCRCCIFPCCQTHPHSTMLPPSCFMLRGWWEPGEEPLGVSSRRDAWQRLNLSFLPSGGFLLDCLPPKSVEWCWNCPSEVVPLEGSPLPTQRCWRSGRAEALGGVPVVLLLFLIPASMQFCPAGVLKMTWIVRPYIDRCVWIYQVEPRCRNTWSLMSFKQTISLCRGELLCVRFIQVKKNQSHLFWKEENVILMTYSIPVLN